MPLNIAVTGQSGVGKSSFVNALCGLDDEDKGAAKTGVIETTRKPAMYPYPKRSKVQLWDLPGVGTQQFQPEDYLQKMKMEVYDFFIILSSARFKDTDAQLAMEISKMGKRFYFVRSKIDHDLHAEWKSKPYSYSEEQLLEDIKDDCEKNLKEAGVEFSNVFLVSSFEVEKYDFRKLEDTLANDLNELKKQSFLPNVVSHILEKKKEQLRQNIWRLATVSCIAGAAPLPGLSFSCDLTILLKELHAYKVQLGLDKDSLEKLAEQVHKPVEDLKSVIKSELAVELSASLVVRQLLRYGGRKLVTSQFMKLVPLVGTLVAGGIAFSTTYSVLQQNLEDLLCDARRVLWKAFDLPEQCLRT
ncbi:interferon-inducible GTPase 5-like [Latimeria chalumnae]|uniref:interferon-inducible GTPase 5-like n=1 Tax=Latimeria chalumnae TaxID=7897 RepID=UPI0006D902A3|nr:PREDICTED: interferon-inducible GTPase 5-like [Latimeria chalumnae]|eukprot:XP_014343718.1 PREDICTED: interferon-inducible GTPase 5-like [Latimeria chalumnae]